MSSSGSSPPFASNGNVDWVRVGQVALGVFLTGFFSELADIVATVWTIAIVRPAQLFSRLLGALVDVPFSLAAVALNFGPARALAEQFGIIGAVAIVGIGVAIVATALEGI